MKQQPPYFLETSLPIRVRKYMEENKKVHIEDMTDYLIQNYKDFNKKKKKPFMKSVAAAYEWEVSQSLPKNSSKNLSKNSSGDEIDMGSNNFFKIDREGSPEIVEISTKETIKKKNDRKLDASFSIDGLYRLSSPASGNGLSESPSNQKEETPLSNKNLKRKRKESDIIKPQTPLKKTRKASIAEKLIPTETFRDFFGLKQTPFFLSLLSLDIYMRGYTDTDLPRSAFISGPRGSGKTMLIKCLAGGLEVPLYRVSATSLNGGAGVDPEALLTELKAELLAEERCILLIDEMDSLSSKEIGESKKSDRNLITKLIKFISDITTKHPNKCVLPIIESRSLKIDSDLNAIIDQHIIISALDNQTKIMLLKNFLAEKGSISSDVDFDVIAEHTTSFVANDLRKLASLAALKAREKDTYMKIEEALSNDDSYNYQKYYRATKIEITMDILMSVLSHITPTLKENNFPRPSNVKWEDVQGLEDVKDTILTRIINPIKNPEMCKRYGLKPSSLLLYGPPGCGKTLLAEAIANAVGINLLPVNSPDLLSMYQGESERNVREIFRTAESVAPCIIFFDEFDSLCPKRTGNTDNGSRHSIVDTLLVEMNGFGEKHKVYVIAATNRPEFIDPAVLRPGRIDAKLYVGFPEEKGREDIFKSCSEKVEVTMGSDVYFEEIAKWCEDLSGADCSGLFQLAMFESASENSLPGKKHFEKALSLTSPSVTQEAHKAYLSMKTKFERSKK